MKPQLQWLDAADISRVAYGLTIEEVERIIQHGHDEPVAAHLSKGRRYRLGKSNDGRTMRVEIVQDGQNITVQLVVIDPKRLA